MNALMTGSHVYGTPTSASDVDLVVLVDKETCEKLRTAPGAWSKSKEHYATGVSVRYGNLNLIMVSDEVEFNKWVRGTLLLKDLADARGTPVTRDEARAVFDGIRSK